MIGAVGLVQQPPDQLGAHVGGAEHDDLNAAGFLVAAAPPAAAVARGEHDVPGQGHGGQRDDRAAGHCAQRLALPVHERPGQQRERHEHQPARHEYADHLVEAAPRVTSAVQAGQQPRQHRQHRDDQHHAGQSRVAPWRSAECRR